MPESPRARPRPHPPEPADPGYGQFDLWLDTADADAGRARELAALLELASRPTAPVRGPATSSRRRSRSR